MGFILKVSTPNDTTYTLHTTFSPPLTTNTVVETSASGRPDSLQSLCGSSRRPKQSQNVAGISRAHDGCATSLATGATTKVGDGLSMLQENNRPVWLATHGKDKRECYKVCGLYGHVLSLACAYSKSLHGKAL
uniref:Uncharacterized protein n=1 Tax=Tanacetum cinerariifolium TaxID=118510 RepID=A0A6L2KLZ4_TANCI|nr:hypothetical protein [Tanacetum cinerariifolium]